MLIVVKVSDNLSEIMENYLCLPLMDLHLDKNLTFVI